MSDGDCDEGNPEVEAPEEEDDEVGTEEAALLHVGRYFESRRARPWGQWSFQEKANYCMDRLFLGFLGVVLLALFAQMSYNVWYVTDVQKIAAFLTDSSTWLFDWLFTQEEKEELFEL